MFWEGSHNQLLEQKQSRNFRCKAQLQDFLQNARSVSPCVGWWPLSHNYSQSHPGPPAATPHINAHLKVLRWRKTQHKQRHQPWCVTIINECETQVFKSISIENKLRLMKVTVTFQQMKREYWSFGTGKIKRPFCAPAPPKQAHGEPWTRHSTLWAAVGTSTTPGADKTGTWAFTMSCWEVFCWVFSLGGFTYTRHNWEIVCFLPSKTANSWELTVSDGCTVRSCKPAWSCQKIKYLETHMG